MCLEILIINVTNCIHICQIDNCIWKVYLNLRHIVEGMTAGMETTMESIATRHTHDHSATPSSRPPTEVMNNKLPDYREPPLGFFEGDRGLTTQVPQGQGNAEQQKPVQWNSAGIIPFFHGNINTT